MDWLRTIYDVLEVACPIAIVVMAARRHRASVALAWFAFSLLLPVVALAAYLYLGSYRLQRDQRRHRRVREEVGEQAGFLLPGDGTLPAPRLARVAKGIDGPHGGRPPVGGNHVTLLADADDTLERLLRDIAGARSHVHVLMYLFNDDATGRRVAAALSDAAKRGVRCRLLVGAFSGFLEGSRSVFEELAPALQQDGAEVAALRSFGSLRSGLERIDLRNHRKVAVVDGRVGYTGSQNVHDPGLHLDGGRWHQMMVRVEGPGAHDLQRIFVEDWLLETGELLAREEAFPKLEAVGDVCVQTLWWGPSEHGTSPWVETVLAALQDARERVVLTTPYFVPDEPVHTALAVAARAGLRVDLVVPERSDKRWVDAAARSHFGRLLDAGVRIHHHLRPLLHAKTVTLDESVAIVGSGNLDWRSFYLDYEAAVIVYDAAFTRAVRDVEERWIAESRPIDPESWRRRPGWRVTVDALADLARPLL